MRIFKPRRGSTRTMTQTAKRNIVLAKGELFLEVPDEPGNGPSIIKIGDGVSRYEDLPVSISGTEECDVVESSASTTSQALNNVTSGLKSSVLFGELKKAISLNLDSINEINNNIPFPLGIKNNKYGYYTAKSNGNFIEFASPADITNGINAGISNITATLPIKITDKNITHENSGVTANTYGPSANVTGSNNTTINIPQITVDAKGHVTAVTNRVYTSVNTSTTYTGTAPISISNNTISHNASGVTANTYGPSANVTGSNNTTINIPQITVDAKGHVTAVTNRVYTSVNTTYGAGTGISLSGTTFSNSGVRSVTINGNYLAVNTNGTSANLTIPYATKAGSATTATSATSATTATTASTANSVAWGNVANKPNIVTYSQSSSTTAKNITMDDLVFTKQVMFTNSTCALNVTKYALFQNNIDCSGNISCNKLDATSILTSGYIASDDHLTAGSSIGSGYVRIYADNEKRADIKTKADLTANRTVTIPDSSGTIGYTSSSRRVKKNISEMPDDKAKKILNLDIVNFDYISKEYGDKDQCGVIAEDTIDIIPEAVLKDSNYDENAPLDWDTNPPMEVDYKKFVPYLIKMTQIQQKEINELKETLSKVLNKYALNI